MSRSHVESRRTSITTGEEEPFDTLVRLIDEKIQGSPHASPKRKSSVFASLATAFKAKGLDEDQLAALRELSSTLKQMKKLEDESGRKKTQLYFITEAHSYVLHRFCEAYLAERKWGMLDSKKGELAKALIDIMKKFSEEVKSPRYRETFLVSPDAALKNTDEARIFATTTPEEAKLLVQIYFDQSMLSLANDRDVREDKEVAPAQKDETHKEEKHYVVNCAKLVKRMGTDAVSLWNEQVKINFGESKPGLGFTINPDGKHVEDDIGKGYNTLLESKDERITNALTAVVAKQTRVTYGFG